MSSIWPLPGGSPRDSFFAFLGGIVSKPVLATLETDASGPVAILRAPLLRVEVIEDYGGVAYLRFDDEPYGTRLVVPLQELCSCGPDDLNPEVAVLDYDCARIELKDVSPEARVRHYQRLASQVLALPPGAYRRRQCSLLAATINHAIVEIDDLLLVTQLGELVAALVCAAEVEQPAGDDDATPG